MFAWTLLVVDSCWASGGPEWLFASAVFGIWTALGLGVLTWAVWRPRVRPKRSRAEKVLLAVPLTASCFFAGAAYVRNPPGPLDIALAGALLIAASAIVMVVERANRAALDGVPLGGGLAAAYGSVRWSLLVIAVVAGAVGGSSVLAMTVLGHSCASGFSG